jgi:hypothetical protein
VKFSLVKLGSRFGSIADEITGLLIRTTLMLIQIQLFTSMRISAFDFQVDPDPAFFKVMGVCDHSGL